MTTCLLQDRDSVDMRENSTVLGSAAGYGRQKREIAMWAAPSAALTFTLLVWLPGLILGLKEGEGGIGAGKENVHVSVCVSLQPSVPAH